MGVCRLRHSKQPELLEEQLRVTLAPTRRRAKDAFHSSSSCGPKKCAIHSGDLEHVIRQGLFDVHLHQHPGILQDLKHRICTLSVARVQVDHPRHGHQPFASLP